MRYVYIVEITYDKRRANHLRYHQTITVYIPNPKNILMKD